ncbi:MAG: MBL fold metallo-hydrolase [Peptococcaceae bacterium]|nr:MBL fold metallo-hydrolase [Peptococcaceae bacterium]
MHISSSVRVLGNGHFNLYLAGGEEKVIIEGGVSGVVPALRRQVNELRAAGEVSRLVVMHAHFDHVCGLPGLKGIFKTARTAASAKAAEVLAKPAVVAGFFREDESMTAALKDLAGGESGAAEPGEIFSPPPTLAVDEVIPEEAVWRLGPNFSLHFYRAPGHSPCSLTAYSPEEEILFSSDSAGFPVDSRTVFPIFFDGYLPYVQTIKSMLDLPVTVLAGAHEEIITGRRQVRAYLQSAVDWAESTRSMVEDAVKRGTDRERLAEDIFMRFYHGRLKIYTVENIMLCSRLIVRRALEAAEKAAPGGARPCPLRRFMQAN